MDASEPTAAAALAHSFNHPHFMHAGCARDNADGVDAPELAAAVALVAASCPVPVWTVHCLCSGAALQPAASEPHGRQGHLGYLN